MTDVGLPHFTNAIESPASSNVRRFSYDQPTRRLRIEFGGGALYEYYDVPIDVFLSLQAAESRGSFLAKSIKGIYRAVKLNVDASGGA